MTNYQVFTLGQWCQYHWWVAVGWGEESKGTWRESLKLNDSLHLKSPFTYVLRKQRQPKETSCALNAPLMWGYGTRLFVRHVIRRWCAFDARGFNHPPNLSITPPLWGPLLGLGGLHKANYWLHSTGNPIFKRQRGIVFIGFQKPAKDKVNYAVVSSPPPGKWAWNTRPLMQAKVSKSQRQINGWNA